MNEKKIIIMLVISILALWAALFFVSSQIRTLNDTAEELSTQVQEAQAQVEALQPTDMQRYFYSLIDNVVLNGTVEFIELGTEYSGTIESYDYKNYVIESDEVVLVDVTVEFKWSFPTYDEMVDMNVYYDDITDPDYTFEYMERKATYSIVLNKGFNTLEMFSYSDDEWDFTIIVEVRS